MLRNLALAVVLTSVAGIASARSNDGTTCTTQYFLGFIPYEVCTHNPPSNPVVTAPEIDASSAAAGLTLMIGGLIVLRGRRSKISAAKA
jgi:hypothetical protein